MDEVEVGGLRIAYERAGAGPPLVLLHGFVGDGRATWARQIEELSDAFTVVAWDAPGAGRSADPPESFRLADYADCLAGLLAALDLRAAHVVGLSFGGALALELCRRSPVAPASLVLAGAYAGWSGSLPADEVEERLQRSLRLADLPLQEFAAAMTPSMFSANAPDDLVAGFARSVAQSHPSGFRTMLRALAEADLRDVLPGIDVPTLVVHGDQDVRAPLHVAEALHAGIRTSRLVTIPGAGHVSCVEAPDLFNHELRAFLQGLPH